jgi:hypothetical protein
MGSRTFTQKQFLTVMQVSDVVKPPNHLEGLKGEENLSDFLDGYCQVGITSPPALRRSWISATPLNYLLYALQRLRVHVVVGPKYIYS